MEATVGVGMWGVTEATAKPTIVIKADASELANLVSVLERRVKSLNGWYLVVLEDNLVQARYEDATPQSTGRLTRSSEKRAQRQPSISSDTSSETGKATRSPSRSSARSTTAAVKSKNAKSPAAITKSSKSVDVAKTTTETTAESGVDEHGNYDVLPDGRRWYRNITDADRLQWTKHLPNGVVLRRTKGSEDNEHGLLNPIYRPFPNPNFNNQHVSQAIDTPEGLRNPHTLCYANSLFQLLINIPQLVHLADAHFHAPCPNQTNSNCLPCSFQRLVSRYKTPSKQRMSMIDTKVKFFTAVEEKGWEPRGISHKYEHKDAQEFLNFLWPAMLRDLR